MNIIPENSILIGILGRTHGVRGAIKCMPKTFDFSRHELLKTVYVKTNAREYVLHVQSSSLATDVWILKFEEFDSKEAVSVLINGELLIPEEERLELPEEQFYISDFSGYKMLSETGELLGEVSEAIELPSVLAFKVHFVNKKEFSAKEILVPFVDDCVLSVNKESKEMVCDKEFLRTLCGEGQKHED